MITILASTPRHDDIHFIISMCCSYAFLQFKCLSSLKSGGFRLAVIHQLEKILLKVIPMILFFCHYQCSCGVDFPIIELKRLLKLILIVTVETVVIIEMKHSYFKTTNCKILQVIRMFSVCHSIKTND